MFLRKLKKLPLLALNSLGMSSTGCIISIIVNRRDDAREEDIKEKGGGGGGGSKTTTVNDTNTRKVVNLPYNPNRATHTAHYSHYAFKMK